MPLFVMPSLLRGFSGATHSSEVNGSDGDRTLRSLVGHDTGKSTPPLNDPVWTSLGAEHIHEARLSVPDFFSVTYVLSSLSSDLRKRHPESRAKCCDARLSLRSRGDG
ncbi:hypothetical protein VUR80DRAFT_689 [Thermomyces stellatus]